MITALRTPWPGLHSEFTWRGAYPCRHESDTLSDTYQSSANKRTIAFGKRGTQMSSLHTRVLPGTTQLDTRSSMPYFLFLFLFLFLTLLFSCVSDKHNFIHLSDPTCSRCTPTVVYISQDTKGLSLQHRAPPEIRAPSLDTKRHQYSSGI